MLTLLCTLLSLELVSAQYSFNVQQDINIGLQVGVSIAICVVMVAGLVGIINALKYGYMSTRNKLKAPPVAAAC
jgi:hypothetical protein